MRMQTANVFPSLSADIYIPPTRERHITLERHHLGETSLWRDTGICKHKLQCHGEALIDMKLNLHLGLSCLITEYFIIVSMLDSLSVISYSLHRTI